MNRKNIKSVLAKKHKEFVASIKDERVRKLVAKNSIVTGGAIVSMLMKEKINDFDYYFTNKETVFAVTEYYVKEFNRLHMDKSNKLTSRPVAYIEEERVRIKIQSAGVIGENTDESQYRYFEGVPLEEGEDYIEQTIGSILTEADKIDGKILDEETKKKERYRPVFLSDNAITLSNKIQVIIRFYGEPDEIHKNYDFVHCTNYWESATGKLELRQGALESILAKQLSYVGSKYPVCSIVRMRKFISRGWHINAGQILKILMQVSELDLTDVAVLEDQLTGVDTAYFVMLIKALKTKQEKNPEFKITQEYVASIVDRIFG